LNILIFEYATAGGVKEPAFTAEGQAMVQSLAQDFNSFSTSYVISKHSKNIEGGSSHPIIIDEDPNKWLENNITNYDFCLPIAPEGDLILYELTRIIEKANVQVLGSSMDAVLTCTDKLLTYQVLKGRVPIIESQKVHWDEIKDQAKLFPSKKVVKPADGVSCSAVQLVGSFEEFKNATDKIKDFSNLPYFLVQNWMEGDSASVSLLSNGKKALPISLNQQDVTLNNGHANYNGGKVPLDHPLKEEAKKVAKKAVESITGLKGYVGVDLILGEEVHLVEINSRITTPYVVLRKMLNFNLGEAILESVRGNLPREVVLDGQISFRKNGDILKIEVLHENC
jgi:tyramine---L-glutamate ligase